VFELWVRLEFVEMRKMDGGRRVGGWVFIAQIMVVRQSGNPAARNRCLGGKRWEVSWRRVMSGAR
jgi:hypothetical protein